jgi:TolA-binding protein
LACLVVNREYIATTNTTLQEIADIQTTAHNEHTKQSNQMTKQLKALQTDIARSNAAHANSHTAVLNDLTSIQSDIDSIRANIQQQHDTHAQQAVTTASNIKQALSLKADVTMCDALWKDVTNELNCKVRGHVPLHMKHSSRFYPAFNRTACDHIRSLLSA